MVRWYIYLFSFSPVILWHLEHVCGMNEQKKEWVKEEDTWVFIYPQNICGASNGKWSQWSHISLYRSEEETCAERMWKMSSLLEREKNYLEPREQSGGQQITELGWNSLSIPAFLSPVSWHFHSILERYLVNRWVTHIKPKWCPSPVPLDFMVYNH